MSIASSRSECRGPVRQFLGRAAIVSSILAVSMFTACATYQSNLSGIRSKMRFGSASQAAAELQPLAEKESRDQLVYLLDYATILQQAGRHKESADAFARAERIADIQDYHSLTNVTSSLLLSEEMIQYKGDDYEKVLINAVNAVNYLEMNDLEGALVEVRKLNTKLYKYKFEAKRDYEQNPFAFYLSAMIWEADQKWDDAYIAYKKAYDLIPDYRPLHADLIRAAIRADRQEDLQQWRKKFPEIVEKPEWRDKSLGEIVLVVQQGWGPRKAARPEDPRFPYLLPSISRTQSARLVVESMPDAIDSQEVFSVERVAIKTLNDDYGRLVASRLAGIAAKAVVADQLRQRNEALGAIAWIAMNVADRADLRQWSTLPQSFQIARMPVRAGRYKVKALGIDYSGAPTGEELPEKEIEVKAGRKVFMGWRTVE